MNTIRYAALGLFLLWTMSGLGMEAAADIKSPSIKREATDMQTSVKKQKQEAGVEANPATAVDHYLQVPSDELHLKLAELIKNPAMKKNVAAIICHIMERKRHEAVIIADIKRKIEEQTAICAEFEKQANVVAEHGAIKASYEACRTAFEGRINALKAEAQRLQALADASQL